MTLLGCSWVFRRCEGFRPCVNVVKVQSPRPPALALQLEALGPHPPWPGRGLRVRRHGQPRRPPLRGRRVSSQRGAGTRRYQVRSPRSSRAPRADPARTPGARLTYRWSAAPCWPARWERSRSRRRARTVAGPLRRAAGTGRMRARRPRGHPRRSCPAAPGPQPAARLHCPRAGPAPVPSPPPAAARERGQNRKGLGANTTCSRAPGASAPKLRARRVPLGRS